MRSVCLNHRFSLSRHRFTSLTFDRQSRLGVRHQDIYSHSADSTRVPWESLTLMVISLALVNGSHHWPVIKWFLPRSNSDHCNHMDTIVLCGRRDKDLGHLFKKRSLLFPGCDGVLYIYHGSTFVWSWLCSNFYLYDIYLHYMYGRYVKV